jgi:Na+/proline symporter
MAVVLYATKLMRYGTRYAHTSLEFMRQRYGGYVHGLFIVLNLVNNVFGCGSMILAGSQLVTGMTGMNVVAACILIPAGVVLYTAVGGLKATFLTDFLHTTIALILLIYFSLAVLTNERVGGPSGLYEKVKVADWYVEGNYKGSLLSFKSEPGTYHLICFVCASIEIKAYRLQRFCSG